MGSSRMEIELEEQLKEAGNMLLSPPSSVEEVINLLDVIVPAFCFVLYSLFMRLFVSLRLF